MLDFQNHKAILWTDEEVRKNNSVWRFFLSDRYLVFDVEE